MSTLKKLICTAVLAVGLLSPISATSAQKEVLILFSDGGGLITSAFLYDHTEWYLGKLDKPKQANDLLKEGWSLLQIVPINAKQHYWVFVK